MHGGFSIVKQVLGQQSFPSPQAPVAQLPVAQAPVVHPHAGPSAGATAMGSSAHAAAVQQASRRADAPKFPFSDIVSLLGGLSRRFAPAQWPRGLTVLTVLKYLW